MSIFGGFRRNGRRTRLLSGVVTLWLVLVVALFGWLIRSKSEAGARGMVPEVWPDASDLVRAGGKRTLVMFVHPECPCSQASLDELNLVMNDDLARRDTEVLIVFFNLGTPESPNVESFSWTTARRIPQATRLIDLDGKERERFGARTSGFVVLYDADSRLRYAGGITGSRGHEGDNVGRRSILALLRGSVPMATERPVYGCALEPHLATREGE